MLELIILVFLAIYVFCTIWAIIVFFIDVKKNSKLMSDLEFFNFKKNKNKLKQSPAAEKPNSLNDKER